MSKLKTFQLDNFCLNLLGYSKDWICWRNIRKEFEHGTPKLLGVSIIAAVLYQIRLYKDQSK